MQSDVSLHYDPTASVVLNVVAWLLPSKLTPVELNLQLQTQGDITDMESVLYHTQHHLSGSHHLSTFYWVSSRRVRRHLNEEVSSSSAVKFTRMTGMYLGSLQYVWFFLQCIVQSFLCCKSNPTEAPVEASLFILGGKEVCLNLNFQHDFDASQNKLV